MLQLDPLNVGTARREDSPEGMLLPAPPERNIRRPFLSDVVPAKQCILRTVRCLTNSAQSTALGKYAGRVLKACCASYAQGLAPHALCLVTKPCIDVVIRKIDEHQNHHYMLCEALSDA